MTDQSPVDHDEPRQEPATVSATNVSGGVNIDAQRDVTVAGDVVGRDKIVGQQVTATGRGIAIGNLNIPLVPLAIALGIGLVILIFIGLMTAFTQQQLQQLSPTPEPGKMTGDIKVAVATFGVKNEQNQIVASVEGDEYAHTFATELQTNLDALDQELKAAGFNYKIAPVRGPPTVRLIEGAMLLERRWDAEKVARQHGADLLLYGFLDIKPTSTTLNIEFYVSDQFLSDAEELTGAQSLGDPKIVGANIQANVEAKAELRNRLGDETRAFALFVLGLGHFGLEHYEQAGAFFDKAIQTESLDDDNVRKIYYLFAGKAAHELSVNLPPDRQSATWAMAQNYYAQALTISPNYARARLGVADMTFQMAKDNCERDHVDAQGLQAAIDGYQQALKAEDQIADANIANKTAFYLGRAFACQSMAGLTDHWADAESQTRQVVTQYVNGDANMKESMKARAADAYANLGLIYWVRPEPERNLQIAAELYNSAIGVNLSFVSARRRLDRQALYNRQLAEIYEALQDYASADAAWDKAVDYEALWYKTAELARPAPSPYEVRRARFAGARASTEPAEPSAP